MDVGGNMELLINIENDTARKLKEDVETVKQKMCDSYCKYPENWDLKSMGSLSESEICQNCPLNNL